MRLGTVTWALRVAHYKHENVHALHLLPFLPRFCVVVVWRAGAVLIRPHAQWSSSQEARIGLSHRHRQYGGSRPVCQMDGASRSAACWLAAMCVRVPVVVGTNYQAK